MTAAVLLFLAPEQPYLIIYNAGSYAIYPAIALAITAVVAVFISFFGCAAVVCDSKYLLMFVRDILYTFCFKIDLVEGLEYILVYMM